MLVGPISSTLVNKFGPRLVLVNTNLILFRFYFLGRHALLVL